MRHNLGHSNKYVRNLPYGFDIYLVNVKTIRQIKQIFVVFSEKLNFTSVKKLKNFAKCIENLVATTLGANITAVIILANGM